jgi:hypothetical protein
MRHEVSGPPHREAVGFRDVPRREAGIRAQDSAPAESCLRAKRSAPSRSRLRPAHPIDLRRSDCRAGEPSTSGAPCSVHTEIYWPIWPASSTPSRQCVANCDNRVPPGIRSRNSVHAEAHRGGGSLVRPPNRPSLEATACRRAINLGRSVLGAIGRLRRGSCAVKSEPIAKPAVCDIFFTSSTKLRLGACALPKRDQGFAEPGALSSTSPADLPLPRTASREGFVLVASRARRSGNLRLTRGPRKGICRRKPRNLRTRGVR